MAGKPKSASGSSFSAARMFEELDKGPDLVLTGMVKRDDNDSKVVLCAQPNDCSRWLPIPQELIREYEYVGRAPCKDHTHPLVNLYLSRPDGPEQEAFAAARPIEAALRTSTPVATAPASLGGGTDCVWNGQLRMWVSPRTNIPCVPTAPSVAAAASFGGGTDCVWNRELGIWVIPGTNPPVRCVPTFVA